MPEIIETTNRIPAGLTQEQYTKAANEINDQMAALSRFRGLEFNVCGVWLWVGGETKRHRMALRAQGFHYSGKKQMWWWKPEWVENTNKGHGASFEYIKRTYGNKKYSSFDEEDALLD